MTPPWLIALALVIGLIVLVPSRRLRLAGLSAGATGSYALALWLLAMVVAVTGGATRTLIPILLIAYVAPFVAAPDTVRRVLRRPADGAGTDGTGATGATGRRPMKNVTPPDSDEEARADPSSPDHDGQR